MSGERLTELKKLRAEPSQQCLNSVAGVHSIKKNNYFVSAMNYIHVEEQSLG